jgi:succinate dehydrogenase / fumarate reductase iron-sulfur subunit
MRITLKVWRQKDAASPGEMKTYELDDISPDMSFLEMFDVLNAQLIKKGEDPVAFDHDCREGICGACSMYINGRPHGPLQTTTCQLHMRSDLIVDRSAFDRIQQAGGYVSVNTGGVPDANAIPIPKNAADEAFDAAVCIGCGASVAACKNSSAALFVGAKISQFALLPQGQPERKTRVERMVAQMEAEGFGGCSNTGACEAECPKGISLSVIARMNREYYNAKLTSDNR